MFKQEPIVVLPPLVQAKEIVRNFILAKQKATFDIITVEEQLKILDGKKHAAKKYLDALSFLVKNTALNNDFLFIRSSASLEKLYSGYLDTMEMTNSIVRDLYIELYTNLGEARIQMLIKDITNAVTNILSCGLSVRSKFSESDVVLATGTQYETILKNNFWLLVLIVLHFTNTDNQPAV